MGMGRLAGDDKIDVVEEGAIGDELIGGPVSVRGDEYKLVMVELE